MKAGEKNYRAWVGPPQTYDIVGATQFSILTCFMRLREYNTILDVGCGSLRLGRFLIVYLRTGKYFGVEPEEWVVRDGLRENLGTDLVERKKPTIIYNANFNFDFGGQKFDFIVAQSVFSHATLDQIKRCLRSARDVLAPGGVFLFNVGYQDEDYTGDEWVYPGCVGYRKSTIEKELKKLGLMWRHATFPTHSKTHWTVAALTEEAIGERLRAPYMEKPS